MNGVGIHGPLVVLVLGLLLHDDGAELLARPIEPSATYCWLGVITLSIPLIPAIIEDTSVELMLPVRSATTATSIGFGGIVPHDPLQATESIAPVPPLVIPSARAKVNGTSLLSTSRIVLHWSPSVGLHGIEQIFGPQRRPV